MPPPSTLVSANTGNMINSHGEYDGMIGLGSLGAMGAVGAGLAEI